MAEGEKLPINFNSEDIKDVAIHLIDKICGGIEWLSGHPTPKRIAVDDYIKAIQDSDALDPRAKAVLIYNAKRDIKKWSNVSDICLMASEQLLQNANPAEIDEDWVGLFVDKASNVSNEELQAIWASILARECNEPGSIPKLLLQILESMGKREANAFIALV